MLRAACYSAGRAGSAGGARAGRAGRAGGASGKGAGGAGGGGDAFTLHEDAVERGGVLGAMETGYQRGKIQDESMLYEHRKHDGSLPLIGGNIFLSDEPEPELEIELARSTTEEKESQISRLNDFKSRHSAQSEEALQRLRAAAINDENVFAELMNAVRVCSLGQITDAFFEVGGQYRRSM